jgi:hypothetical protein
VERGREGEEEIGLGWEDAGVGRETREFMGKAIWGSNWRLTIFLRAGYLQVPGCVRLISERATSEKPNYRQNIGTNTREQRSGEHSRRVR